MYSNLIIMDLLQQIAFCIEKGKIDQKSPYPPDMKGQDGADELTQQALVNGVSPVEILNLALVPGMRAMGNKFRENKIFVPEVLMAARAMARAMTHLKPYFQSGEVRRTGIVIIGTVTGDLHDIGKNLVAMMVEGGGWEVIDLGVDVGAEKFLASLKENPSAVIALSALLTTTMENMKKIVSSIKEKNPSTRVMIGGAPVTQDFCERIGADFYSPDPQGAVDYLKNIA